MKHTRNFGQISRSYVTRHRCRFCQTVYTVYSDTVFANKHLRPAQVIILLRGVCKGESTAGLAHELQMAYDTVHHLRQQLRVVQHIDSKTLKQHLAQVTQPRAVANTDE